MSLHMEASRVPADDTQRGTAGASRRLRALVLAVATTAALIVSAGGAATAQTTAAVGSTTSARTATTLTPQSYETRLGQLVNQVRARHGLHSVRVRTCTDGFAEKWTNYLVRNGEFRHQSLGPIMSRCSLSRAGEILALGSVTPRQMIRMWLNSPGHRAVMLDPHFRIVGVAARQDANNSWVGCIDFGRH